jgi:transposase-like protein/uncharacterized coiled-coil protein SlyX
MTVTAIRRVGRSQALEQLRLDPSLSQTSLSALAKRWGVSRSTARGWTQGESSDAPAPPATMAAAMAVTVSPPAAVPVAGRLANCTAYAAAGALATVAAYFSVSGMIEIFPGAPVAVVGLAGTMEASKLVTAGWLARHWRTTGALLRAVLLTLVAGLATINAAGVYGRLVEAHVGVTVAASSSIGERIGALDARLEAQAKTVAGLDQRIGEIDGAIGKLTEKGRATTALNAMASQRKARDALTADRVREAAVLVELRTDRAMLDGEHQRADAADGPVVYMAAMLGVPVELAVRWLILLMVLTCDPTAIALTVAAARRGVDDE